VKDGTVKAGIDGTPRRVLPWLMTTSFGRSWGGGSRSGCLEGAKCGCWSGIRSRSIAF